MALPLEDCDEKEGSVNPAAAHDDSNDCACGILRKKQKVFSNSSLTTLT